MSILDVVREIVSRAECRAEAQEWQHEAATLRHLAEQAEWQAQALLLSLDLDYSQIGDPRREWLRQEEQEFLCHLEDEGDGMCFDTGTLIEDTLMEEE